MIDNFSGEYDFLSSFYLARVKDRDYDIQYPSVEHGYQAQKTMVYAGRVEIAHLSTPGKAKRAGQRLALRVDWEEVKTGVMYMLVRQKFQDPVLAAKLIATGDQELREGNYWHDQYWGDCTCPKHKDVPGENMLGQILMTVRSLING